ncbi:MAG TPA: rod shape-determining protein MreC [Solirubrobacteraceae bacterium]
MYDKTVRRRRAVLVLLVALSLILLTAYFREAPGGGLHSVQRGFLTVVSPIQDGANKALKPVRDLFGWFGDTLHAKSQRDQLRKQVDHLQAALITKQANERSYGELLKLFHLDNQISVSSYTPVTATVVAKSPNIWYSTVTIDAGTSRGVRLNDPVVNGEGLVGKVTEAASDAAQVSLITDSEVGVSAMVNTSGVSGIVQPKVGDPNDLLLQYLPANSTVNPGDYVVTAGTVAGRGESLFPPGIPIGQVSSIDESSPYKAVNVHPLANLHNLDVVQVLTTVPGGRAARLGRVIASLPPGSQTSSGAVAGEGAVASTGGGG